MIARCKHCLTQIRDCTMFERIAFSPVQHVVIGWYHTTDGHERCPGRATIAEPQPLVHVGCRFHPSTYDDLCLICDTAMQVSGYFHNDGRCVPRLCSWMHVH